MIVTRMMITDHLITGDNNTTARDGTLMMRGMMINQDTRDNQGIQGNGALTIIAREMSTEAVNTEEMAGGKTTGSPVKAILTDPGRIMITPMETMDLLTEPDMAMNPAGEISPITGIMKSATRAGTAGTGAIEIPTGTRTGTTQTVVTTREMSMTGGTEHLMKYPHGLEMMMQNAAAGGTA